MKKVFKILLVTIVASVSLVYFCWANYYAAEFMNLDEAKKKWGIEKFDIKKFREGASRAPMAVDIVKRQLYVGKDRKVIRQELGDPDSYFFSDTIYAYKIMPFPGAEKENWHLVFIPDSKLEKVKEVKIHKKCCYKSPL